MHTDILLFGILVCLIVAIFKLSAIQSKIDDLKSPETVSIDEDDLGRINGSLETIETLLFDIEGHLAPKKRYMDDV